MITETKCNATTANRCNDILIVEDDEGIRDALRMTLELEGYHVSEASNGQEGLGG